MSTVCKTSRRFCAGVVAMQAVFGIAKSCRDSACSHPVSQELGRGRRNCGQAEATTAATAQHHSNLRIPWQLALASLWYPCRPAPTPVDCMITSCPSLSFPSSQGFGSFLSFRLVCSEPSECDLLLSSLPVGSLEPVRRHAHIFSGA